MSKSDDFRQMDDATLLSTRADMRTGLERLPPMSVDYAELAALYDKSTEEVNERARKAWTRASHEERQVNVPRVW